MGSSGESMGGGNRLVVMHFVSGGGSGATRVAMDLAYGQVKRGEYNPLLVFRRKREVHRALREEIALKGIPFVELVEKTKAGLVKDLIRLIREHSVSVMVAHGNSEHLWGREAGIRAALPVILQVEQNCERYVPWRWWQSRRLEKRTDAVVCVSPSVASHLARLGADPAKLKVIPNAVDVHRFSPPGGSCNWEDREWPVAMVARFASQKDHATLIRAIARLRDRGTSVALRLIGGGRSRHRRKAERLAQKLGVESLVEFMGARSDIPECLWRTKVLVLSSHYEGMCLSLMEGMAAGCSVIGTKVPGIVEVITHGRDGYLVAEGDADALALAIQWSLADESGGKLRQAGHERALRDYTIEKMTLAYDALIRDIASAKGIS